MRKVLGMVAIVGLTGSLAWASNVNISVQQPNGTNAITVAPGATVNYQIQGVLTDDLNEGLALIGLSLHFEGGPLGQADTPAGAVSCENPMPAFVKPDGITNPAGYGGTLIGDDAIQIGGGQNTIRNPGPDPPFPIGTPILGVAQPSVCGPAIIVTGSLTAPDAPGTYVLSAYDIFANVITEGESLANEFLHTEAAGTGAVQNLSITVEEPSGCDSLAVISTDPPNCAIDARLPHDPANAATKYGFESIAITYNGECPSAVSGDFTVSTHPAGPAPTIVDVASAGAVLTLELSGPIDAGRWTCFTHTSSGAQACLGFLPGDPNNDRTAAPADILDLIDDLNNVFVPPMAEYQCDSDRSLVCNPADILTQIDMLNGASELAVWNGATLPACPSAP